MKFPRFNIKLRLAMNNTIKTIILLGVLSILLIFIGGILAGKAGLYIAFLITLVVNGSAYFFSDKIALAASRARPLAQRESPEIYKRVDEISKKYNIPVPKIYITPEMQANAFATGRDENHASLALTQGLLHFLSQDEIRGVVAHEMAHIKNKDVLITSIAAVLASAITFLGNMGWFLGTGGSRDKRNSGAFSFLLLLLAPIGASLLQLAVSREREYEADRTGAKMLGSGESLAQALLDISTTTKQWPKIEGSPAFSSLYISNPFEGNGGIIANLFSTHPPIKERVYRLRTMDLQ